MSSEASHRADVGGDVPRTHEVVIRSFPGRVLTVTVLGNSSMRKRPFSFDSCLPAEPCETAAKRACSIDEPHDFAKAEGHPAVAVRLPGREMLGGGGRGPLLEGSVSVKSTSLLLQRRLDVGPERPAFSDTAVGSCQHS
jgi:hypothetical protein